MGSLHFDITGDNSNFMDALKKTEIGIKNVSRNIESSGISIESMFDKITKSVAGIGAAFSAQQFASQVMKVRGEFQQLEVAFTTMLDSAEKANSLMNQLVKTAATTPFGLQDVASGAKQLLAYGLASDKVNDTLVRLGDVAAGLSIPLNDLVYLYGTTMTQGKLFTQDLRQFQGRGVPLADELAKQFGVTKDKVGELVTEGKVGFENLEKAIVSMTSKGGKFGGLMEAQSRTITGQISNIEDAIDGMFNTIGQSSEGVINLALSGVSTIVENWQKVADAIGAAASAYGMYKAVLMAQDAMNNIRTGLAVTEEVAELEKILEVKNETKNADLETAVASDRMTQAKATELAALRAEAEQRLVNLNIKKREAALEEAAAIEALNVAKAEKEAADYNLEAMQKLYDAATEKNDAQHEAYALEQLQTATVNYNTASTRVNTAEKNLNAASSKAKSAAMAADTFATNVNTAANHANTKSIGIMKAAVLQLQGILKGMWATLMSNPLAIVAGAVGVLAYGVYKFATRESEAEKATRKLNEALSNQSDKYDEQKRKINDLVSSIGDLDISEGTRISNLAKLKQEYPQILKDINTENEFLREKHRILQEINKEQGKQKQADSQKLLDEAERKLAYYQRVREEGTDTSVVDMDGNGWATDNIVEAIEAQIVVVNKLKAEVSEPVKNNLFESLSSLKDEKVDAILEDITHALQALENAGDDAVSPIVELGREFSKGQIKDMQTALQGEKTLRGGAKNSASQWLSQYKKEYEAASKAVQDFMANSGELSEIDFERQLKDLKDKRDAAKKKYEDAGGSVKTDGKQADLEKERAKEILSVQRKIEQDRINLMKDGAEKRIAQIELDFQKELDAISEQRAEWEKKQHGRLTDEQHAVIGMSIVMAEDAKELGLAKLTKEETDQSKKAMNDYLKEYGTWMQKREAITTDYTERINKATTEGEKLTLGEQMKRELAQVDDEAQAKTATIIQLFGDMSKKTVADMRTIANKAQEMLSYLESGEFKSEEGSLLDRFGLTKEQFELLRKTPEKLEAIKNEIFNVNKEADKAEPILTKMSNALKKVFNSGENNETKKTFDEDLKDILDGVGAVVEAADFLGNSLSQISEAFGGNFLGGIAEGIGVATDAANAAMSGAQAGSVFGPWGAAAGAAIGAISSLTSSLSKLHDKGHEKKIQKIQEQIETLEKSYDLLGEKIEDAYSNDASKLIDDQNKLLEQQKVLIQNQIKEEESKKKTDKNRIKEWQQQIEEINKTIQDNKEAAIDAIFGDDLKSAIEDFASAYIDAWSAGEDKAKSSKDMVKNMIKNMITESIKAAASDPMKKIREKLLEFWSDEYISGWEQDYLNTMASDLQKELDSKFGWANGIIDSTSSAYSQEATSKGFQTMSQETGEELNGRFTALQISNEEVKNQMIQSVVLYTQMLSLTSQSNGILSDILMQQSISNGYLSDIAKYSKIMSAFGDKIDKIVENTKNL